jgi:hypothetical protein
MGSLVLASFTENRIAAETVCFCDLCAILFFHALRATAFQSCLGSSASRPRRDGLTRALFRLLCTLTSPPETVGFIFA